jgi:hypothetical protein
MRKDQKVELTAVAQPGKSYSAKVTRIGGEINKSRALVVEATLDPQSELVPGMFAEAHVVIGQTPRPALPATAVIQRGKLWHAFIAIKGELQDRIVQVGPAPAPGQVSILQGVVKGDKVVAKVTDKIVDGLRVVE